MHWFNNVYIDLEQGNGISPFTDHQTVSFPHIVSPCRRCFEEENLAWRLRHQPLACQTIGWLNSQHNPAKLSPSIDSYPLWHDFFSFWYLSTFFLIVFTNFTASFAPIIQESITFSIKDRHLFLHSKSPFPFLLQVIHFSKCSHFTNRGAVPGHPGVDHLLQHASVSRVLSALDLRRMWSADLVFVKKEYATVTLRQKFYNHKSRGLPQITTLRSS